MPDIGTNIMALLAGAFGGGIGFVVLVAAAALLVVPYVMLFTGRRKAGRERPGT